MGCRFAPNRYNDTPLLSAGLRDECLRKLMVAEETLEPAEYATLIPTSQCPLTAAAMALTLPAITATSCSCAQTAATSTGIRSNHHGLDNLETIHV